MFFTTFLKERFGYIAFVLAVFYFLFLIRGDVIRNDKLNAEKKAVSGSLEAEKARSTELKNKMQLLKKDAYIEKLARDKLGVVERGERPYKVITE